METILLGIFMNIVLPIAGSIVTGFLALSANYARKFIKEKVDNQEVENALLRVTNTTETIVKKMQEETVKGLKASAVDGSLSAEDLKKELSKVKATVIAEVNKQVPLSVDKIKALAVTSATTFISDKIESLMVDLK